MNETKRMLVAFGAIVLVILVICLIAFWPEKDTTFTCDVEGDKEYAKTGELTYENFKCLKQSDSYLVAVSSKITTKDKKALNSAFKTIDKGVYLVSLDNYSKEDAKKFKEALNYEDEASFEDVLLYVKDGEVKAYEEGILDDSSEVKNFLKENKLSKFLCSAKSMEDYENLGEVDYDGLNCLKESGEPFVVVLAQTTCSYCQMFEPVINGFAGDNDTVAYVINIDTLGDSEDVTDVFSYFETNTGWGTPLTLAVKDGEVVKDLSGATEDTDEIKALYQEVGILNQD